MKIDLERGSIVLRLDQREVDDLMAALFRARDVAKFEEARQMHIGNSLRKRLDGTIAELMECRISIAVDVSTNLGEIDPKNDE